jgi:hypothetical protein
MSQPVPNPSPTGATTAGWDQCVEVESVVTRLAVQAMRELRGLYSHPDEPGTDDADRAWAQWFGEVCRARLARDLDSARRDLDADARYHARPCRGADWGAP